VSSKTKKDDTGVSLLMRKNEVRPVQVASTGVLDYHKHASEVNNSRDNKPPVVALADKTEKPICKNGDPVYVYDVLGRVISMTTPVGTTTYHYDSLTGRLDQITSPEGKAFTYSYNHGQLSSLQYPNGITAQYAFDDNGNLTDLNYVKGGSSVKRYQYKYDKNGMRDTMIDNDGVHAYAYDAIYQITQATHPTVQNPLEQFTYDAVGNRMTDLTHSAYQYNELNQLLEDDSCKYLYDLDGNQTEKIDKNTGDTTAYTYDIENKLVEVRKAGMLAQYAYDALGRRMSKTMNGVAKHYRYNVDNLVLEMNGNDSVVADYTFGPGIDNPLEMNRGGSVYFYVKDGLGSVTALASESGNVCHEYAYGVFGKIISESGDNVENCFTYTSREFDRETGLMFYRARMYNPQIGRFISEDPIGSEGGINLYRYSRNCTTNYIDPDGLDPCCSQGDVSACVDRCVSCSGGDLALAALGLSATSAGIIPKVGRAARVSEAMGGGRLTNLLSLATHFGAPLALRQIGTLLNPIADATMAFALSYYITLRFVTCPVMCKSNCNSF
jgi:RHS repeat-associated protein